MSEEQFSDERFDYDPLTSHWGRLLAAKFLPKKMATPRKSQNYNCVIMSPVQGSSLNSIEKALLPLFKSESNSVLLEKVTCIIKVFILSRSFDILSKVEIDFIPIPIFSSNFKSNTFFYERTLALKK